MAEIAFVFAGQGAQYSGMGKSLYESSPAAREIFDRLDALRPGTSEMCFSGSDEDLKITSNTQPCMFAVELAAAAALSEAGIKCGMAAGFSLGEIAALTYTGAVSLEDGFRLVCRRGELMQQASETCESGMAAVVKLSDKEVEGVCAGFRQVWPVNYNCPGQISCAGAKEEMADFAAAVKQAGGRAIPLKVAGAFHSPFMAPAAESFDEYLKSFEIKAPKTELYSDYTARPYEGDFRQLLSKQICNPVRWQTIVENMSARGAGCFIELGPGKTLSALISKTVPGAKVFSVDSAEGLAAAIEGVKSC